MTKNSSSLKRLLFLSAADRYLSKSNLRGEEYLATLEQLKQQPIQTNLEF